MEIFAVVGLLWMLAQAFALNKGLCAVVYAYRHGAGDYV
jgi:hypothetical protein